METIEVHSKDFVIRWAEVEHPSTITWKAKPLKRSINFAVYVHNEDHRASDRVFAESVGSLTERLEAAGFKPVSSSEGLLKIESKDHAEGSARIEKRSLVAFVFDNTFSRSNSKHVQFSFNTEVLARTPSVAHEGYSAAAAAAASAALYPKANHDHHQTANHQTAGLHYQPPQQQQQAAPQPQTVQQPQTPGAQAESKLAFPPLNTNVGAPDSPRLPPTPSSALTGPAIQPNCVGRKMSFKNSSTRRGTLPSQNSRASGASAPSPQLVAADEPDLPQPRKVRSRQTNLSSVSSGSDSEAMRSLDGRYVNGYLQKKRRKQFQGFARRYFSLDKRTGLLNYYLNNRSSSLRGVMPIKIAQLRVDKNNLQMTLNSGMEKWTLKANDSKTFDAWCDELKQVRTSGAHDASEIDSEDDVNSISRVSTSDIGPLSAGSTTSVVDTTGGSAPGIPKLGALGVQVPSLESLRSLILAIPDGLIRKDLHSTYINLTKEVSSIVESSSKSKDKEGSGAVRPSAKSRLSQATIIPLMKRRKTGPLSWKALLYQLQSRNFIAIASVGLVLGLVVGFSYPLFFITALVAAAAGGFVQFRKARDGGSLSESDGFAEAYGSGAFSNRSRESLASSGAGSGAGGSDDDDDADDFSDASDEDEKASSASVCYIPQTPSYSENASLRTTRQNTAEPEESKDGASTAAAASSSDPSSAIVVDDSTATTPTSGAPGPTSDSVSSSKSSTSSASAAAAAAAAAVAAGATPHSAETSLYPLPHDPVKRRTNVTGPAQAPPSLLALLKKAKDPSNMTAPITSNEPLSGVEAAADMYENSDILDAASRAPPQSHERVMLVAVFAVSRFSTNRNKERTLRKPFTPLLGETFEMVREDRQFRFLAEKVMHKPEVIATQAESPLWTVYFTSRPHTKMWTKSIQLTDVGHVSITFPDGESVSFINPEMFIRNILAGERYVEPSGSITIESSAGPHLQAQVEFKAGGMFSGRSEEVKITSGKLVYEGKWTEAIYEGSNKIWSVKPLVDDPTKHYGWSVFTAQLNELTDIEDGQLPPNDSRLRPDLRLYEGQKEIEKAEQQKLDLEQKQRERRKELENAGKQHEPFFFVKSKDSKGHYILRHGDRNYWVLRQKQQWDSIPHYFKQ